MATIRRHRQRWQVQFRRSGHAPLSKSFIKKSDAEEWARHIESQADRRALPADMKVLDRITLQELLERYIREVLPCKRAGDVEKGLLEPLMKRLPDVMPLALSKVTPHHFSSYRDARMKSVKPSTICRELGLVQHAFDIAVREWDIPIPFNPVAKIAKPKINNRRERRLTDEEKATLLAGLKQCLNPYIEPLVLFAIETGMRRGEIINAEWKDLDVGKRLLHIPETKNGEARTIPLSQRALEIAKSLEGRGGKQIFPVTVDSLKLAWQRLIRRTKIKDLHFHDLRHEAISRFFEIGLAVPEVALISGHRDFRMLFRYTHLKPEAIVEKLG